ncbi:MAG: DNA polymerase IV [Longimicrobiales bacterium]|nr:DNA polymerase IV [Longimicrobiales bacterium]
MDVDSAPRRILLVDCDQFFVQVARLEDPEGAGRAELLIVGGSASGRGVVTSASYPCRAFGVRSAMPTGEALCLCPDATVVGVPRSACSARSRRVRDALHELAPVVQAASIDEFYLDLTGTERLFRHESFTETADRIRRAVFDRSRIRVSIGGGTNRLVAKLATRRAKPNGVHLVAPGEEATFLAEHDLAEIPGVGPALTAALGKRGLVRVPDLLAVEPEWLVRWFGASRAAWLLERARGEAPDTLNPGEPRKSISAERTFAEDLDDDDTLEERVLALVVSVTRTLRHEALQARTLTLRIRDADFTTRQRSHTFPEAVELDSTLFPVARTLLADLRARRRTPARLVGVGLGGLVPRDAAGQLALFDGKESFESDRLRTLHRAMDGVRDRFGADALLPGRIVGRNEGRSLDGRDVDEDDVDDEAG